MPWRAAQGRLPRVREAAQSPAGQRCSSGGDCAGLKAGVCITCRGVIIAFHSLVC